AEGPAPLLPADAESVRAAALVAAAWPGQAAQSSVVVALYRPGGLTDPDRAYARRVAVRLRAEDRPGPVLRVVGPDAPAEVAARLVSRDGTVQLVLVPLSSGFVSEANRAMIDWLMVRAREEGPPEGLDVLWTGDALIGRD